MQNIKRVGLIGWGAIGASIARIWRERPPLGHTLVGVCVRPAQIARTREELPPEVSVCQNLDELLALRPDSVIEAAGHNAIQSGGAKILLQGCDLYVLSVGSLANDELRQNLAGACRQGGAQVLIPAGALAGFDGLRALAQDNLVSVKYTSTKPPAAWIGTPAAAVFPLDTLTKPTVIFRGNAAEAATQYPKNANLAAAVALAGIGLERTQVELVADPSASGNTGVVEAASASTTLHLKVSGRASANPKTSAIVGASVLAALANRTAAVRYV